MQTNNTQLERSSARTWITALVRCLIVFLVPFLLAFFLLFKGEYDESYDEIQRSHNEQYFWGGRDTAFTRKAW